MEYMVSIQVLVLEKVSLVVVIIHPKKPVTVGLVRRSYNPPKETFYSWTCIAMEYIVSIEVLRLEKVSLVVLIVHLEKPFTVGLV